MAKQVKEFTRPARKHEYHWDKWTKGGKWEIQQGRDFAVSMRSMRGLIYYVAGQRGLAATTSKVDERTLQFEFYRPKAKKGARP